MRVKKEFIYIVACVVFVVLGFGGGYFTGKLIYHENVTPKTMEDKTYTNIQSFHAEETEYTDDVADAEDENSGYYLLINENEKLSLYEINQDGKVLIKQINFNPNSVPAEDGRKLSAGVRLNTIEEGYSLIEDFTS